MTHYYFIEKDGVKQGPFKYSDLKIHEIDSEGLVWRSDDEIWKKASDFEELRDIYKVKTPQYIKEEELSSVNGKVNKNIDISEQLIVSLIIGFLLSFVFVIFSHLGSSDFMAVPESDSSGFFTYSAKVSSCSYKCALGMRHSINCGGLTFYELKDKSLNFGEILSGSFEHYSIILIFGIILSISKFFLKRFNFRIVK